MFDLKILILENITFLYLNIYNISNLPGYLFKRVL